MKLKGSSVIITNGIVTATARRLLAAARKLSSTLLL